MLCKPLKLGSLSHQSIQKQKDSKKKIRKEITQFLKTMVCTFLPSKEKVLVKERRGRTGGAGGRLTGGAHSSVYTAQDATAVFTPAARTSEKVGRGRLLGGGARACIRSSTNPLVTSRSRSSSASTTAGADGSGVARSSGFLRCALGGSSPGLGARGFFLLYSPSPVLLGAAGFPIAAAAARCGAAAYLAMLAITGGSGPRAGRRGGSGGRESEECRYGVY
jgi:hypothetical protein